MLWRPAHHRRIVQLADAITTAFSFIAAYFVWIIAKLIFPWIPFGRDIDITHDLYWKIVAFAIIWTIVLTKLGAYTYQRFKSLRREVKLVAKASLIGTLILLAADFILRFEYIPRTYIGVFLIINFLSLAGEKIILFKIAKEIRKRGKNRKKILVVGSGVQAKNFIETVEKNLEWGLDIVGLVAENGSPFGEELYGKKIFGTNSEIEKILHQNRVDEVIICASGIEMGRVEEVLETCEREGVQIRINSDFFGRLAKNVTIDQVYGLPIISFTTIPDNEWSLYLKRLIDILVSGISLIVLSPFFLIIAILVKFTSEGPIFYEWNVVGFNKKPFHSWKFRTMVKDADAQKEMLMAQNEMKGPVFKIKDDPRITKVGKFLRQYSLDELPQLWSVFKGDMSLVGPRPVLNYEWEQFNEWQRQKLSVKPGAVCLWHIRGQPRDINEWVKLDLEYIENWSLWLDIKILFGAIWYIISGKNC
jgi:exopolysaccharide biosynthesis polyprenyl glycosylphosphotransferase